MGDVAAGLGRAWRAGGDRRGWWAGAAVAAMTVVAVFVYSLCSMIGWVVSAVSGSKAGPDTATLRQVDLHDQDAALVSLFAKWCVKLYEEATPATLPGLSQCFPQLPPGVGPSGPAATATDLDAWAPRLVGEVGGANLWSVLVAVTVKEFTAPAAVRKYVWLSVVLPGDGGGPRATLMPSDRATALPAGPDVELAYTHPVAAGSPLAGVVNGFIAAYLQGPAADVARYVTAESALVGLGLYDGVTIESMTADAAADGPPAPAEQVHVLVSVTGTHASGGVKRMDYPLLLVEAGGRWAVAGLEDMPAVTGRLVQAGGS